MPLVCPLLGVTGCNWVEAWMHSWKDLCFDIDKQPFGSSSGGLCNRACTSDEISVFINWGMTFCLSVEAPPACSFKASINLEVLNSSGRK